MEVIKINNNEQQQRNQRKKKQLSVNVGTKVFWMAKLKNIMKKYETFGR